MSDESVERDSVPPVIEILTSIASIVCLLWAMATHPTKAQCPKGWWLPYGVRETGEYRCLPVSVGGDDDVLTGKDTGYQPLGEIRSRIYCTGGTRPIIDQRTGRGVGCQRR